MPKINKLLPRPIREFMFQRAETRAMRSTNDAQWARARVDWKSAARWSPGKPSAATYLRWARACRLDKHYAEAERVLTQGVTDHPRDVRMLTELALIQNASPDQQPVADAYEHAKTECVEIIICVHNALEAVKACLDSVKAHTSKRHTLILVDDASEGPTRQYLDTYQRANGNTRVIRNTKNLGYTKSANIGLHSATTNWVVLLNSDTVVTADWLETMLLCAACEASIRAVGPLSNAATMQSIPTMTFEGRFVVNGLPDGRSAEDISAVLRGLEVRQSISVPVLNGFCTLFHRQTVADVGYLDEARFPIGFGEETNLCLALVKAGHRLCISTKAFVYHQKSRSFGTRRRRNLKVSGRKKLERLWKHYDYHRIATRVERVAALRVIRKAIREQLYNEPGSIGSTNRQPKRVSDPLKVT